MRGRHPSPVTYAPCPRCGGIGKALTIREAKGLVIFECENGHLYSTVTARNGLLLEIRS